MPGTRVAPVMTPFLALLDASIASPLPSSKPSASTRPGCPLETTSETAVPGNTFENADGDVLITVPSGIDGLLVLVVVPMVRPEPVINVDAAADDRPATFGTATSGGPDDTINDTKLFGGTPWPPTGVCVMTVPLGATLVTT